MNVVHVNQFLLLANYPMHFLRGKSGELYFGRSPKINQFTRTQLSMGIDRLLKDCRSQLNNSKPWQLFNMKNSFSKNEGHQVLEFTSNVNDDAQSISNSLLDNKIKKYAELEKRRKIGMANKGKTRWNKRKKLCPVDHDVELERRRKIAMANTGKTPWNKGKTHSPETCELIKRKLRQILGDPKIRKKMSEFPRPPHSAERKAKIGFSQRKRWAEQLKRNSIQEKCYLTWSHNIAEAAKAGSQEQQELEWDSYEKLKASFILEYLQWKDLKAEAKLEKAADAKKAKALRRAEKVKEIAQIRLAKRSKTRPLNKRKLSVINHLRRKLKRTQMMPPILSQETGDNCETNIQKWDLELIKQEKERQRVSFADQIHAAKVGKRFLL